MLKPLAHRREHENYQSEAEAPAETVDDALREVVLKRCVEEREPQHDAVRGDEREVDAEDPVELRVGLLEDNLECLHHERDYEDVGDGPEVRDLKRRQDIGLGEPGEGRRDHKNQSRREPHAE